MTSELVSLLKAKRVPVDAIRKVEAMEAAGFFVTVYELGHLNFCCEFVGFTMQCEAHTSEGGRLVARAQIELERASVTEDWFEVVCIAFKRLLEALDE